MQSNNLNSNQIKSNPSSLDPASLCVSNSTSFTAPSVGRKRRPDKGMPDEASRYELAQTYLKEQARHWPELIGEGVLQDFNDDNAKLLADDLRCRFLGDPSLIAIDFPTALILSVAYLRFSDLGSNPRTLDQQLINILVRAKREGHFIPWTYVFTDAGITATIARRRGYQQAKQVMEEASPQVRCLYIDEVGRMSRDVIETLMLMRALEAKATGATNMCALQTRA